MAWAAGFSILCALACGRDDVGSRALPADVAVVHCTPAGRNLMPPILLRSPAPPPPTGLYARRMDPMALGDMGYERDRPVCAGLLPPDPARVEAVAESLQDLSALAYVVGRNARTELGRCMCDIAYAGGIRGLLPRCAGEATRSECAPSPEEVRRLGEIAAPLLDAVRTLELPRIHWRLAGRTDRATWLADKLPDLVARHVGGSSIYRAGDPIPHRDNYVLLERLREVEGVVAVASQDGGDAILVARVLGDAMILDHFSVPIPATRNAGLLEAVDNARADDLIAALALPEEGARWVPGRDPRNGAMVEVDRAGLLRMDELQIALSVLGERAYPREDETWEEPTALVDRVTLQAPHGAEGLALDVELQLSEAGKTWAAALPDVPLSPDASELSLSAQTPRFVPPAVPGVPTFWMRDAPAGDVAIHGLHWAGELMRRVELEYPGSLQGSAQAWELTLPQGSVGYGGAVEIALGTESIADVLAARPMHARAVVDPMGGRLKIELRPR